MWQENALCFGAGCFVKTVLCERERMKLGNWAGNANRVGIGWNSSGEAKEDKLKKKDFTSKCTGCPLDGGNYAKLSSTEKIAKNQK